MPNTLKTFNAAKAAIDAARVVSFDFFDTLVARVVEEPWHAYYMVEKAIADRTGQQRSFVAERREAETAARKRVWEETGRGEVTLDEIYLALMDFGFSADACQSYKVEEIAVEKAICYAEPHNKKLYDYAAAAGKPVIIITDMYLPLEAVTDLACQCGYTAHRQIFVSSAHGETKRREGLFAVVLETMRNAGALSHPGDMVHIGDNVHSDIAQAGKRGIQTRHHAMPLERFRREGLKDWKLLETLPNDECPLTRSLIIGLYIRYWLENGARPLAELSLRDIGFYVAGPLLLGQHVLGEGGEQLVAANPEIQDGAQRFATMYRHHANGYVAGLTADLCRAPWQSLTANPPALALGLLSGLKEAGFPFVASDPARP
jgi:predicted HAD superfamily hydrolase